MVVDPLFLHDLRCLNVIGDGPRGSGQLMIRMQGAWSTVSDWPRNAADGENGGNRGFLGKWRSSNSTTTRATSCSYGDSCCTNWGARDLSANDREILEASGTRILWRIGSTCSGKVERGYGEHTRSYGYKPHTEAEVSSLQFEGWCQKVV